MTTTDVLTSPAAGLEPAGETRAPNRPSGTGAIDGSFAAGSFAESALTGITMPALITAFDNSTAYVLVKTQAHPNGELRGQVQRAIGL